MYQRKSGLPSPAAFLRAAQMSVAGAHGTSAHRDSPDAGRINRHSASRCSGSSAILPCSCDPTAAATAIRARTDARNMILYLIEISLGLGFRVCCVVLHL